MAPRTPLLHPRSYFEGRGFAIEPALAAVAAALVGFALALVGFGVMFAGKLSAAGHADAAGALWSALIGQLVAFAFFVLLGWLLVTVVLHLIARAVLSHDGRFGETLAVTGWGFATTLLPVAVSFVMLALALSDTSFTTPEAFLDQFRANLAATDGVRVLVGFAVTGWQTYIYAHGLAVEFDGDTVAAGIVAGVVAYAVWLLGLI